jgi:hypothetical protein
MYDIPGTPLMALSSGVTTALEQTSALAPTYLVVTETAGGAISGYWVTGKPVRASNPKRTMKTDITRDKTGLRMNKPTMVMFIWMPAL